MNEDLLKKIESLEKRVKELESKSISLFGKAYTQVGNPNSDYLIKTKGQVKIQYGSKTIDLIKNNKLNVDTKFIFTGDEVGDKEGIWIVKGEEVWIKQKSSKPINIKSSEQAQFVSYKEKQEVTAEEQLQALSNLGFFYATKADVNLTKNGLVYVIADKQLYIVENNNIAPFIKAEEKKEDSTTDSNYITFENGVVVINNALKISNTKVESDVPIITNLIKSPDGRFVLSSSEGKGILQIDEIVYKNSAESKSGDIEIYPSIYLSELNIITKVEGSILTLSSQNTYKTDDILEIYISKKEYAGRENIDEIFGESYMINVELKVTEASENTVTVESSVVLLDSLKNKLVYLKKRDSQIFPKLSQNGIEFMDNEGNVQYKLGTELLVEKAGYSSGYVLPDDDNSSAFASTEWVRKLVNGATP